MTSYPEIWNALARDFDDRLIRSRPASGGRSVSYLTARTVMNRLDSVLGFESWEDAYERDPGGGDNIVCRLTITLPDGRKITKCDSGSPGSTGDEGEDDKGAFSDAFKRAAVKFGIGRSLYGDGCYLAKPPQQAALPGPIAEPSALDRTPSEPTATAPEPEPIRLAEATEPPPTVDRVPRTGAQLLRWVEAREADPQYVGLSRSLKVWARDREYPKLWKEWSAWQVSEAHGEACQIVSDLETAYHATVASR